MISPQENRQKALVVDSNREMASCLYDMIDIFGISCDIAHDTETAAALLKKNPYSLVFIDTNIPRLNGLMLHVHVKRNHPGIAVALMSAYDSTNTDRVVTRDHPDFYLAKPFRISDIENILNEVKSRPKAT
jgi:DNA-binding response OmpR family regulator